MKNLLLFIFLCVAILGYAQNDSRIIIKKGSGDMTELSIKYDADGKRHVKVEAENESGELETLEWEDDGEIPADIRAKLREMEIDIEEYDDQSFDFDFDFGFGDRAALGVRLTETDEGVEIDRVYQESAAEKAGLEEGDILVKIEGEMIRNVDDVNDIIRDRDPGDKISIEYLRDGKNATTEAELQESSFKGMMIAPHEFNFDFPRHFEFDFDDFGGRHLDDFDSERLRESLRHLEDRLGDLDFHLRGLDDLNFDFRGFEDLDMEIRRARLGVVLTLANDRVVVEDVQEESAAEEAGLKEGDVILEIDGEEISEVKDVVDIIRTQDEGDEISITYLRDNKQSTTVATLKSNEIIIRRAPRIRVRSPRIKRTHQIHPRIRRHHILRRT